MQCKQCGETVTADMLFCGNCGCPVPHEHTDVGTADMAFCPECGNKLNPGDIFCGECGYRIEAEKHTPEAAYVPPVVPEDRKPVSTMPPEDREPVSAVPPEDRKPASTAAPVRSEIKSTMMPREGAPDAEHYREGKKFLRVPGDFK